MTRCQLLGSLIPVGIEGCGNRTGGSDDHSLIHSYQSPPVVQLPGGSSSTGVHGNRSRLGLSPSCPNDQEPWIFLQSFISRRIHASEVLRRLRLQQLFNPETGRMEHLTDCGERPTVKSDLADVFPFVLQQFCGEIVVPIEQLPIVEGMMGRKDQCSPRLQDSMQFLQR